MKFAVIGLGNLGRSLAENLIHIGHEVVGIDHKMQKLDMVKQQLTSVVCMDCTDTEALQALSLNNFDGVFVTFSKDFGVSVQAVALLKSLGVEHLIVRAISEVHKTVLQSIGVKEIITPEKDFATDYALRLLTRGLFKERFDVGNEYSVLIFETPKSMFGEEMDPSKFKDTFELTLLCVRRSIRKKNILGVLSLQYEILSWKEGSIILQNQDQLVVFGTVDKLKTFRNL